jgi:hypothetical protein
LGEWINCSKNDLRVHILFSRLIDDNHQRSTYLVFYVALGVTIATCNIPPLLIIHFANSIRSTSSDSISVRNFQVWNVSDLYQDLNYFRVLLNVHSIVT